MIKTTEPMTPDLPENPVKVGIDVQRLVLLLASVERHLLELYGNTVADFESDPIEEEGWILYCKVKAEKRRISKQNASSAATQGSTDADCSAEIQENLHAYLIDEDIPDYEAIHRLRVLREEYARVKKQNASSAAKDSD